MELLSASRGFLKCNFHCHTTCSDGRLSPKARMSWLPIARWITTCSPSPTTAR